MAQFNWARVREHPLSSCGILGVILWRILKSASWRCLTCWSRETRPSLRIAIGNLIVASCSGWDGALIMSAPKSVCDSTRRISNERFEAYLIPETAVLDKCDRVVLYLHGGGFMFGHPLQYRSTYQRWFHAALKKDLRIAIVALAYPLAPAKQFPTQIETVTAAYEYLTKTKEISAGKICVAGDSAGGNLAAAFLLHIRNNKDIEMPGSAALLSPWLDLTTESIKRSTSLQHDILVSPQFMETGLVPQYAGAGHDASNPLISPILAESVEGLPSQLVVFGSCEAMAVEAEAWIEKCRKVGVHVQVYVGEGALHAFGVGGLLCGKQMESEVDEALLELLLNQVPI